MPSSRNSSQLRDVFPLSPALQVDYLLAQSSGKPVPALNQLIKLHSDPRRKILT